MSERAQLVANKSIRPSVTRGMLPGLFPLLNEALCALRHSGRGASIAACGFIDFPFRGGIRPLSHAAMEVGPEGTALL